MAYTFVDFEGYGVNVHEESLVCSIAILWNEAVCDAEVQKPKTLYERRTLGGLKMVASVVSDAQIFRSII